MRRSYWNCTSALRKNYPNPFLVKIVRAMAEKVPDVLFCSNGSAARSGSRVAYWGRSQDILRCGILPFCDHFLSSLCALNGVEVSKSGVVEHRNAHSTGFTLSATSPVADLFAFSAEESHIRSPIANAPFYTVHYLCNENTPYPSATLHRSTWSGVCLLFTMPCIPSCFYKEDEGRSYKVTAGDETLRQSHSSHVRSRVSSLSSMDNIMEPVETAAEIMNVKHDDGTRWLWREW